MLRRTIPLLALLAVLAIALAPAASAHTSKTSEDGKVRVTWGWTREPAATNTLNALDLVIRDNETSAGIGGLEKENLTVEIRYGDEVLHIEKLATQFGKGPGNYTGSHPITPTKPGIYTLHLRGTIAGSSVDVEIPANHEMTDITETMFPAPAAGGDLAALEARIAALEAQAKTASETPATTTPDTGRSPVPGFGMLPALAVLGVAALLVLRRR